MNVHYTSRVLYIIFVGSKIVNVYIIGRGKWCLTPTKILKCRFCLQWIYMLSYQPEDINKLKARAVRLKCERGSIRY